MTRTPKLSHRLLQKHSEEYLSSLSSAETRGTYGRALREFLRWQKDHAPSFSGNGDVLKYRKHLEKKKKLSAASVATYLTSLRRLCDHLVKRGVLHSNPVEGVSCSQATRAHTRGMLSLEETRQLLSSIEGNDERGKRDLALFRLMLDCGLTPVELVRADIGDLTLNGRHSTLAVQRKGRKKKDTLIELSAEVKHAVRDYLEFRTSARKSEPLFESSGNRTRGARMTPRGLRSRISFYMTKAGIESTSKRTLSPASLRHTAVALSVQRGATIEELRSKFHIGTDTTAKLYISPQ
ncbi:MAG: tyrosine-type recombinase/integrase [Acidobacteriota bacterium]